MNNLIPSIILSISILSSVILLKHSHSTQADKELRAFYNELTIISEEMANTSTKGNLKQIVSGVSSDIINGVTEAFDEIDTSNSSDNDDPFGDDVLSDSNLNIFPDKITFDSINYAIPTISETEKVIGIVSNECGDIIKNVTVTAMFYDENDSLIDVIKETIITDASLKNENNIGFFINRDLTSFDSNNGALPKKSTRVEIKISSYEIVK